MIPNKIKKLIFLSVAAWGLVWLTHMITDNKTWIVVTYYVSNTTSLFAILAISGFLWRKVPIGLKQIIYLGILLVIGGSLLSAAFMDDEIQAINRISMVVGGTLTLLIDALLAWRWFSGE